MIDFHTHAFSDAIAESAINSIKQGSKGAHNYLDGTVNALLSSMNKNKIDKSVVLTIATKPSQTESINLWATEAQEQYKELIFFGTYHPDTGHYKEVFRFLRVRGIKGIKFHPVYQDFDICDRRMLHIYDIAAKEGFVLLFHMGDDSKPSTRDCSPKSLAAVSKELQGAKIVAAHLGGLNRWDEVEEHLVGTDVYMDTALIKDKIPQKQLISIIKNHGKEKILFGTDSPWADQQEYIAMIKLLNFNKNDEALVFHKNAEKLLRL